MPDSGYWIPDLGRGGFERSPETGARRQGCVKMITHEAKVKRPTKSQYYVDIASAVAMRSTCLRRRFGAVIVKNDQIISTGYNGAPRQTTNCIDLGYCIRQEKNIPAGQNYELCRAVHAEMNALIHASRLDMAGADLYLVGIEVAIGRVGLTSHSLPAL